MPNTNSSPTKLNDWIQSATRKLQQAGISTARLDALVLLEDILNTNRAQLLAHPDTLLTPEQTRQLDSLIGRRAHDEPLAYVRGKTEFYGRDFLINQHVLEPRPESETMITLLKQLYRKQHANVADIGSGSGALGITAALELNLSTVYLHDIDAETLEVASKNAALHNVSAECIQSDLIKNNNTQYDILLCNLPYVPDDFPINQAATHEPKIAIFGGPDGLDLYRKLFAIIQKSDEFPRLIFTESLPFQHPELTHIAESAGYTMQLSDDFIQVFTC